MEGLLAAQKVDGSSSGRTEKMTEVDRRSPGHTEC